MTRLRHRLSSSIAATDIRPVNASRQTTIGEAVWNQSSTLIAHRDRIARLLDAVGCPEQLSQAQAMSLFAVTLEWEPDLIVELGRGRGNSTAILCEAANVLRSSRTRVVSLCLTPFWDRETRPRLASVVDSLWYQPLTALKADIVSFDYAALFQP